VRPALAVTVSRPFSFFKVVGGHWKVIPGHDRLDDPLAEPAAFWFGQTDLRFQMGKDRYCSLNGRRVQVRMKLAVQHLRGSLMVEYLYYLF
jgi:hypothetical protein